MPANPKVIDRFNVDGEDYVIEPEIDPVPIQNSQRAVMSGGVWQAIKNVEASANFLNNPSVAGAVFGHLIGTAWRKNNVPSVGNTFYYPVDGGDIIATYCLISSDGYFRWSVDGKQWTDGTVNGTAPTGTLFAMLHGGGLFVAAIMNGSGGNATLDIYSSSDGKEWNFKSTISSFFSWAMNSDTIVYFSGEWWMVTPEGLKRSVDLITWDIASELTWPSGLTVFEQRAGLGIIDDKLIVCTTTDLWYTTDKTTWTKFFTPLSTALGVGSLKCRDNICACLACALSDNEPSLTTFSRDLSTYVNDGQNRSSLASTASGINIAGGYIFWLHSNQNMYISVYQNYSNSLVADIVKADSVPSIDGIRYANGLWIGSEKYSRDLVRWNRFTYDINGASVGSTGLNIGRVIYVERLGRWVSATGYSDIDVLRSAGVLSYQV